MSWLTIWPGKRPSGAAPRPSARPRIESLEERQVPTANYYGGNLLPHVEAQAVYYGSGWSSSTAATQPAQLDAFLNDLVGTSGPSGGAYMSALSRAGYGVGTGTASAGYLDKAILSTPSTITDASIQARLAADIKAGAVLPPDANRLYVVYVQPNVAVNLGAGQGTTQQGILGYHGAFAGPNGATVRYAVIAYPGGTVGNSSLGTSTIDQLTAVTSHEVAESATDPDVNYARLGWYDPRLGEIGDITENNPNAYVRLDSGAGYLVQEVADRNDQLLSIVPPALPPAGTTATSTTLSASAVHYSWYGPATATLTVTVTPASGTVLPGGTVELLYNGSVLGTGTLRVVNGKATVTFNLAFYAYGDYTFTAEYLGNSQFQGSNSSSVTVHV